MRFKGMLGAVFGVLLMGCAFCADNGPTTAAELTDAEKVKLEELLKKSSAAVKLEQADTALKASLDTYAQDDFYIALDAQIVGADTTEFKCANSSFWNMIKEVVVGVENNMFLVSAEMRVAAYTTPRIPLVVLSDIKGNCRYHKINNQQFTPMARMASDATVNVNFYVQRGTVTDFKIAENLASVAQAVVGWVGGPATLISVVSADSFNNQAGKLDRALSAAATKEITGAVLESFSVREHKGLRFSPEGFQGDKQLTINLIARPRKSLFTEKLQGTGESAIPIYPDFNSVVNNPVYPVERDGAQKFVTLYEHLNSEQRAAARVSSLLSAGKAQFIAACEAMNDELQQKLSLSRSDRGVVFFGLLRKTAWNTEKSVRELECPAATEVAYWRNSLKLPVSLLSDREKDDARRVAIERLEPIVVEIDSKLKYAATPAKKAFFAKQVDMQFRLDDPAEILGVPGIEGKSRDDMIVALSNFSAANAGCHSSPSDRSVENRTTIILDSTGRKLAFTIGAVAAPTISSIDIVPIRKDDVDSIALMDRVISTSPSAGCKLILRSFEADFPNVAAYLKPQS